MSDIDRKVLDWFIAGDTGISSEAMAAHLTGRPIRQGSCGSHLYDPGNLAVHHQALALALDVITK